MMKESFLQEIESGMRRAGYADRSQFVRDAVQEKLAAMGLETLRENAIAPMRLGKGGVAQVSSSGGTNIFNGQPLRAKYALRRKASKKKKKG